MKVCIIGLGYIGFPTACLVAKAGHEVIGVDNNRSIVETLSAGRVHIVNEDGLNELGEVVLKSGRLRVGSVPEPADVFLISVPTPFGHSTTVDVRELINRPETQYEADLTYVEAATRAIAPFVRPHNLVILESTVPPRTTEQVVERVLRETGVDTEQVLFAHAPERVLPGNIIHELVHNNRIVGGLTPEAGRVASEFYQTFVQGKTVVTDATTAELVKLMENTFRDVNIALSNEFSLISERIGVDVWEAIHLANLHPRVNFLRPGPGVGGHCIAVDPYFVIESAPDLSGLIQAARRVNRRMPLHVLELFERLTAGTEVKKVAILGAAYKANVGDERESPALEVAELLRDMGMTVRVHDPYVERFNKPLQEVFSGSDAIVLITDHSDYQRLEPAEVARLVAQRQILDTRGCLDTEKWEAVGFHVVRLGTDKRPEGLQPSRTVGQ